MNFYKTLSWQTAYLIGKTGLDWKQGAFTKKKKKKTRIIQTEGRCKRKLGTVEQEGGKNLWSGIDNLKCNLVFNKLLLIRLDEFYAPI